MIKLFGRRWFKVSIDIVMLLLSIQMLYLYKFVHQVHVPQIPILYFLIVAFIVVGLYDAFKKDVQL